MIDTVNTIQPFNCTMVIVTTGDVVAGESYEIARRRVSANGSGGGGQRLPDLPGTAQSIRRSQRLLAHDDGAGRGRVEEVDSPALTILYDMYHQQITEGNLIANLHRFAHQIGHIHTAGVPGRHELLGGENDYSALFRAIDSIGHKATSASNSAPPSAKKLALKRKRRWLVSGEWWRRGGEWGVI
ncbi:MAG: TIM barrel protein [Caldilineaceae bacterium]